MPSCKWEVIAVLPNVRVEVELIGDIAAVVGINHPLSIELFQARPGLRGFLNRFKDQFGGAIAPSMILRRSDSPKSYWTYDARAGLRDILSVAAVPLARANRAAYRLPNDLAFADVFDIYPWIPGRNDQMVHLQNIAMTDVHVLELFNGQSTPGVLKVEISPSHFETELAQQLMVQWVEHFAGPTQRKPLIALFRALNMAREAARMPSSATLYDVGRSIALWVSAYEILAHRNGQSGFRQVLECLDRVSWDDDGVGERKFSISYGGAALETHVAGWLCRKIYKLRNDFLHGNAVSAEMLSHNDRNLMDYAACLFRFVLSGFVNPPAAGAIGEVQSDGNGTYWLNLPHVPGGKQHWWTLERALMTVRPDDQERAE